MSFATFADLKARIFTDTSRATDATFGAELPGFVRLAEQRMFHGSTGERVRVRDMETSTDLTVTLGDATLPDRYLEPTFMVWLNGSSSTEPLMAAPREIALRRAYDASGGPVQLYTIEGNILKVWPAVSGTVKLGYSRAYAPLVADADTNWLLTNAPGVYFHGIMIEAYRFLRDPEKFVEAQRAYIQAVSGVQSTSHRGRFSATSMRRTSAFA